MFRVIDSQTGNEADAEQIALTEQWAKGLMYCDMEGFALTQHDDLILLDECGKYVFCDRSRFIVEAKDE